jgi:hypothetical protein
MPIVTHGQGTTVFRFSGESTIPAIWFHNGERFNADAVRINWEEYRKMENPADTVIEEIPDETMLEIIDEYTVRFMFPAPTGLAFIKFLNFCQIAPSFYRPEGSRCIGYTKSPFCACGSIILKRCAKNPSAVKKVNGDGRLEVDGLLRAVK